MRWGNILLFQQNNTWQFWGLIADDILTILPPLPTLVQSHILAKDAPRENDADHQMITVE